MIKSCGLHTVQWQQVPINNAAPRSVWQTNLVLNYQHFMTESNPKPNS